MKKQINRAMALALATCTTAPAYAVDHFYVFDGVFDTSRSGIPGGPSSIHIQCIGDPESPRLNRFGAVDFEGSSCQDSPGSPGYFYGTDLGTIPMYSVFHFDDAVDTDLFLASTGPAVGTPDDYSFEVTSFYNYTNRFDNLLYSYHTFISGTYSYYAVPEPSTWASLFIGFGALGCILRRRKPLGVNAVT